MTSDAETRRAIAAFVGRFVEALVRSGVRHFCVCPGSRSTPLALAIARHPDARLWMHLDERSASFFGLGLAKASREPVALVCTSGTAAANFFPAVVEAYYARIPLVVLTADRPHELRDAGAAQTIDQIQLYGSYARWFVDLPEPDAAPELIRYAQAVAARVVATARGSPPGPVHVNCPFREPLVPTSADWAVADPTETNRRPPIDVTHGARTLALDEVGALAGELAAAPRGLIVAGPQDDPALPAAVAELACRLGYPILADPLSGVRCGGHDRSLVLDRYDAFIRDRAFVERFEPDVVLRFGAVPTSKPLTQYLERHGCRRQILVDGHAGWNEPSHRAERVVHADGRLLCVALAACLAGAPPAEDSARGAWVESWRRANDLAGSVLRERLAALDELFEGKVFAELARLLPEGAVLYAGNSMPVRDLDAFFPATGRRVRLLANRGVNGIDGVVSSALGTSAASGGPLVLVIGDLSFYHDSNGLLAAARHGLSATIVLLNNDGGGIFSFLPQANEVEEFETLFGTPHGLDFRPLAETYGARFSRVKTWEEFREATQRGIAAAGLAVVEVPTERARNAALHRQIWQDVSAAVARDLGIQ